MGGFPSGDSEGKKRKTLRQRKRRTGCVGWPRRAPPYGTVCYTLREDGKLTVCCKFLFNVHAVLLYMLRLFFDMPIFAYNIYDACSDRAIEILMYTLNWCFLLLLCIYTRTQYSRGYFDVLPDRAVACQNPWACFPSRRAQTIFPELLNPEIINHYFQYL